MNPATIYLSLLALLLAITIQHAQAELLDASAEALEEQQINTPSLRQRRGQDERRLFYWGNLLYALKVCNGSGGGLCPKPHCDGPLKPPSCSSSGGGSGGGGGSSSSGSSSGGGGGGGGSGQASYVNYDGANANYADGSYVENAAVSGGDHDVDFSDGVSSTSRSSGGSSRFNFLWYLLAGAAVTTLVGGFLVKKRQSQEEDEDDEFEHQLSQSVSRRLENLLAGKGVRPIHDDKPGPAFVELGKDGTAPTLESVLPKMRGLEEPDEEAIEVKLDRKTLSGNYVQMA